MLWTQTNTIGCTYTSTLLYDFEINKTKGAKQGSCLSDAGLGSMYLCLTQDNCCLFFMDWPSATFCTLHLKTPQVPKATVEGKGPQYIYCMCPCIWKEVLLCFCVIRYNSNLLYNLGCHYIYFGNLHIACVVKLKFTSVLEFTFFST